MAGARSPVRSLGALWTLLEHMRIEEPLASRSFEQALAEEQGWSQDFAQQVSREYRRFVYLAATTDEPVTPSIAVDKAWHLHLTYSRHYWEVLCGEILHRPLHHVPGDGSEAEDERHRDQYAFTLGQYEATFGEAPSPLIWPRFEEPRQVNTPDAVPFAAIAFAAVAVGAVFVAAAVSGVVGFLLVCLSVGFGLAALIPYLDRSRRRRAGACGSNCGGFGGGDDGCAGCGGGCGGD